MTTSDVLPRTASYRAPLAILLSLLAIAILTFACYYPGLSGPFAFDDAPNILDNTALAIHTLDAPTLKNAALSGNSGLLKRPISMLSFALNFYASGFNSYYFKLTNVVIHLLCGAAIWLFTTLLLGACVRRYPDRFSARSNRVLCLAVTAAWLLHPINLTAVLYVVQRMTSLATLVSILSLCCYVAARVRIDDGRRGGLPLLAGAVLLIPVTALCKEIGILLPLFFLVIEFTIFQFATPQVRMRHFLFGFHGVLVLLPGLAALAYLAMHPDFIMATYRLRDFTLAERLLTETRVMWLYLGMIVYPRSSIMGLYHDDFPLSHGWLDPATTLLSLLGLLALLGTAWWARRRAPLLSFGLFFFLAGHVLESTILPLEMIFEHRNYLPCYGIILIGLHALLPGPRSATYARLRLTGVLVILLLLGGVTAIRAHHWGNLDLLAFTEAEHHPESARTNIELGVRYSYMALRGPDEAVKYLPLARERLDKAIKLAPNETTALLAIVYFDSILHSPMEPEVMRELLSRLKHARLNSNTSAPLNKLIMCKSDKVCVIPTPELMALVDAALGNPTLLGITRSTILTGKAQLLLTVENNLPAAIDASLLAIEATPKESFYRTNAIEMLIAARRHAEAREQLRLGRQIDVLGENSARFDTLAAQLAASERSAAPSK